MRRRSYVYLVYWTVYRPRSSCSSTLNGKTDAHHANTDTDGLMRNYLCIYISSGKLGDDSKKRIIIIVSGNNKNSFQSTITTRITRYSIGIVTKIIKHDIW